MHGVSRSRECDTAVWRHRADLTEPAAAEAVVSAVRPEIAFHLASINIGSRSLDAVEPLFDANLSSTVRLLVAASRAGVGRVVLAGSMDEPREADAVPCSPYAAAKWASAGYGRMFQALYGLPVVSARIFMGYGPAQADYKVVPYAILALLRGEVPKLTSGTREVDWVYVDDIAGGLDGAGNGTERCI